MSVMFCSEQCNVVLNNMNCDTHFERTYLALLLQGDMFVCEKGKKKNSAPLTLTGTEVSYTVSYTVDVA